MLLVELKIKRIVNEIKRLFDVDIVLLKDIKTLSYLFSELYNPPPEEVSILSVLIDVKSLAVTAYVSLLDYQRVKELYGSAQSISFVPVFSHALALPEGVKVLSLNDMRKEVRKAIINAKAFATDTASLCKQRLCSNVKPVIEVLRRRKIETELELIKKAIEVAEKAIVELLTFVSPGISEKVLSGKLVDMAMALGAEGVAFSPIIAIGKNSAKPHHTVQNTTFNGCEPILIDFGVRVQGYVSDVTRMIIPKRVCNEYANAEEHALYISEVIDHVINIAKPGLATKALNDVAREKLRKRCLDVYFIHGLGHGIGIDVHELPRISPSSKDVLLSGDVITVEPGVYIFSKYGIRIEEDIHITENSSKLLTTSPRILYL
jgi:Xaa-Pro aminopeptidase